MKRVSLIALFGISAFCGFASDGARKAAATEAAEKPVVSAVVNENDDPQPPPPAETIYRSSRNGVAIHPGDVDNFSVPPSSSTPVYSGTDACRTWWLAQPVYPGCPRVNSYYYYANGTGTQTTPPSIFITYCPF